MASSTVVEDGIAVPDIVLEHEQDTSEDRAELTARLLREAAAGDAADRKQIQDEIVVLNMCVANAISARFRGKGIPAEDLTQVAYIGLCKAVHAFDPSFERDFLSYAVPCIRGEIKRHFRDLGWTVRPTRRIQELQGKVSSALGALTQTLGRSPRPNEVAQYLEVPVEDVIEALSADGCFTPTSLDAPLGEDGGTSLGDLLPDDDHEMTAAEARVMLAPAVRRLSARDRRILYLRFFKQCTQDQIAQDVGVTQMQVSRLLAAILSTLRGELD